MGAGYPFRQVMYVWCREELQLFWKAAQRRNGRKLSQTATAFRVGMHAGERTYKKYVQGLTDRLARALNGDVEKRDDVEAFFARLPGTHVRG